MRHPRRNPMFAYRQKRQGPDRRMVLAISAAIASIGALIGLAWFLAWSPSLRITDITVSGASLPSEEKIRRIIGDYMAGSAAGFVPRTNVPFFDTTDAGDDLRSAFYFDDLKLETRLPHSLTVTVREKPVAVALIDGNRFLGLDASGFVIRELTDKEIRSMTELPPDIASVAAPSLGAEVMDIGQAIATSDVKTNANPLPLIENGVKTVKSSVLIPGKQALAEATVSLVITAFARLPDIAGPVRWFLVDEDGESVQAAMQGGWDAYLTTAIPFDDQGNSLGLVLKEKIKDQRGNLQYVDLRYNKRIFFRLKDQPEPTGDDKGLSP